MPCVIILKFGGLIMPRCPGQDMRYWVPKDIATVLCPNCGAEMEIWKDEPFRMCRGCNCEVRNPNIKPDCAKWCKFANECFRSKRS